MILQMKPLIKYLFTQIGGLLLVAVTFALMLIPFLLFLLIGINDGRPGLCKSLREAEVKGVLVQKAQSNLDEILYKNSGIKMQESWIECSWVYKGISWFDFGAECGDGYRFCVRLTPEDYKKLTRSGFPLQWSILHEGQYMQITPPKLMMMYFKKIPDLPLVFKDSSVSR